MSLTPDRNIGGVRHWGITLKNIYLIMFLPSLQVKLNDALQILLFFCDFIPWIYFQSTAVQSAVRFKMSSSLFTTTTPTVSVDSRLLMSSHAPVKQNFTSISDTAMMS